MSETIQAASPQQLDREGKDLYQKGEFLEAALSFVAAGKAYQAMNDTLMAAEMANNSSVAYLQGGDKQAAFDAVAGTELVFAAQGDLRRQGMALGNRAFALEALGDFESAADYYQQSADILQQCGEQDLRAHALKSLSALQLKRGKQIDALFTMKAGLDGIEKPSLKQRILKKLLKLPMKYLG
jgi:tetratricopeptide (TPR) repeat protein